jgi:hypothetical protein
MADNFKDFDASDVEGLPDAVDVVVTETKKGYKTTEFWLTVVSILAVWLDAVPLPTSKEGYVVAALGGVYALSRGLAKNAVPAVEAKKV